MTQTQARGFRVFVFLALVIAVSAFAAKPVSDVPITVINDMTVSASGQGGLLARVDPGSIRERAGARSPLRARPRSRAVLRRTNDLPVVAAGAAR